jgi:hypothetical protein
MSDSINIQAFWINQKWAKVTMSDNKNIVSLEGRDSLSRVGLAIKFLLLRALAIS